MKAGALTEIKFKKPLSNGFKYCVSVQNCEEMLYNFFSAVDTWSKYFAKIKEYKASGVASLDSNQLDALRALDWEAHTASIKTSSLLFGIESGMLPDLEKEVSLGWGRFVEYIAAVRFDAAFENIAKLQPLLAQRILSVNDKLPNLDGLDVSQTVAAGVFVGLYTINQCSKCGSSITDAWKKAMEDEEGRAMGRDIMTNAFSNPATFPGKFITVVKKVIGDNSIVDLGALVVKCALCGPSIFSDLIHHITD